MITVFRKIKKMGIVLIMCALSLPFDSFGQTVLTLDSCYQKARENYPLIKQFDLLEQTKSLSLEKTSRGYLPQINIGGQATYQSDVTSLPISLPNMSVPTVDKDQYKIYGEIIQPITDLWTVKQSRDYVSSTADVERQKVEVEMYKLRDRVNQLYFSILLSNTQIEQTEVLKKDITAALEKTNAAIANGVAMNSNLDLLQAEMLKINQRIIEIKSTQIGLQKMLGLLIGAEIEMNTEFMIPAYVKPNLEINRPEIREFELQQKAFDIQYKLLSAKNIPRLSAFLQSGYGRPALNMLNNDFDFYYMGGLRLSWNLSTFYTSNKEKKLINHGQHSIDIQKETFLLNTNVQLTQQMTELEKLAKLIETDKEIIQLRENIKQWSESQLENGVTTTIDHINIINVLDQAKLEMNLHQIKLLMAQYGYNTISGN